MNLLMPRDPAQALKKIETDIPPAMRFDLIKLVFDAYRDVYRQVQAFPLGLRKDEFGRRLRTELSSRLYMLAERGDLRLRRRIVKAPRASAHFVLLRRGQTFILPANTKRISGLPRSSLYLTVLNSAAAPDLEDLDLYLAPRTDDLPVILQYGHSYPVSNVPREPNFLRLAVLDTDGKRYICSIDLLAEARSGQAGMPAEVAIDKPAIAPVPAASELPNIPARKRRGMEEKTEEQAVGADQPTMPLRIKAKKGD
ncbi:hypothetical protein [Deinococcus sonorensis]|uniref:Uncharacterized protein n=1 Tax=Deinococcus sonorensis TaxID=309891 RepID=A0ABV8YBC0_9DEIO